MPVFSSARPPLTPGRFAFLPLGAVRARGDLAETLRRLKARLVDPFGSLHPQSGQESAWFGGSLPADQTAADLLEAKLYLSALLPDAALRREALFKLTQIGERQDAGGCLGPDGAPFAARGRMLRAMAAGYSLTGDKVILRAILRYFKFLRDALDANPLSPEDAMHAADTLEAGIFFYNVTGQKAILPVLKKILDQSFPYTRLFHTFPYRLPIRRMIPEEEMARALSTQAEDGYTHQILRSANGANLCEGLRASGLAGRITGSGKDISAPEIGLSRMNRWHGTAVGAIASDPLLCGTHPSSGITTRSVSELLASLETLMTCPGSFSVGDQWENCFYNAALAAFAADFSDVLPAQQPNSPAEKPISGGDAEDAACMLSVIPRFIHRQWMRSPDGGLAAMGYAACQVQTHVGGALLRLTVGGHYPSEEKIEIRLSMNMPCAFPLHLRIPLWAGRASAAVCGETHFAADGAEFITISRQWQDGDTVTLCLPMPITLIPGYHQSASVARGPLRFVWVPAPSSGARGEGNTNAGGIALSAAAPFEAVTPDGKIAVRAKVYPLPEWNLFGEDGKAPPIDLPGVREEDAQSAVLVRYCDAPRRIAVFPVR